MLKFMASLPLAATLFAAWPTPQAHAHINMEGALKGREGDQKTGPCEGKPRGPVYKFEPGATIELHVNETIAHDGYFRIAFDNDGQDGFVDPQSIDPINPNRNGVGQPECLGGTDRCGESDFCNVLSNSGGPTVLWDNLDPHIPSNPLAGRKWSWTVTLPNIECSNCTIQVMQVMEDPLGVLHGPFDGKDDLYYRCIDIVLEKGVGMTPGTVAGTAADNNGIDCTQAEMSDGGVLLPDASVTPVLPDSGSDGHSDGGVPHDHDGTPVEPGGSNGNGSPQAGSGGNGASQSDSGGCSVGMAQHAGSASAGLAQALLLLCAALVLRRASRA